MGGRRRRLIKRAHPSSTRMPALLGWAGIRALRYPSPARDVRYVTDLDEERRIT